MLVNEAFEKILSNLNLRNLSEKIPVSEAFGRILSEDVIAVKNLPCFDNSALDGYAVSFDKKDKPYKVIDNVFAGDKRTTGIKDNECIKIMTGAKMPIGADTVMRFEDCTIEGDLVYAPENLRKGDAHRFAGEEVKIGEILLSEKTRLNARAIMMLAAQGISFVSVYINPRIAIYSSGDEIKEPWQNADNDEIYNANALGISAILSSIGFKSSYLGIIKDDFEATKNAFAQTKNFDVIICSG
ncbi:MAG: molybdopterin molybdotransferase MoeA [Campylobacter sp.]|nr:molybdopterin molybdotransferase MoeA [Campylobacter sp.]